MSVTIYHNPRCSKSRATLQLLEENGVTPDIIAYMDAPPSAAEFKQVLAKLGLTAKDVLRKKEAKEEGIDADQDEDALIATMLAHPRTIERPIVVKGAKAALGRPPENVLGIL